MYRISILFVCAYALVTGIKAQSADSLTLSGYLQRLKCCHPIARIADYSVIEQQNYALAARGNFDPQLNGDFDRKSFDGNTYYQHVNGNVSGFILPGGIGYSAGYELNSGSYLNPEFRTPTNGLYYAGVNVPLLQGMITDWRRTALRQAKVLVQSSEEERKLAMNELLFQGYSNFIFWYAYYQMEDLYERQVQLTQERLVNIRESVFLGDRPALDTVDALAMLANWQMGLAETRSLRIKYTYLIAADLWNDDGTPTDVESIPAPKTDTLLNNMGDLRRVDLSAAPKLQIADFKTEFYRLERRLKAEYLKPKLNVKYNFLYGTTQQNVGFPAVFDNYKAGIYFSMPLLLRTERGQWKAAEAKWKIAQYNRSLLERELQTKLRATYLEIEQGQIFYLNAQQFSTLSKQLANAEQIRFYAGDSNFFTLFLRDTNYMTAVQKEIKAWADLRLALIKPAYISGKLVD